MVNVICPKCHSGNVLAAPDEAPPRALRWMKCFACGKRWDQAGAMLKACTDGMGQAAAPQEASEYRRTRTADDVMDLVMSSVKARRGEQDEKEHDMTHKDEHEREADRCQGRQGRGQCKRPAEEDGYCSAHSGQATSPSRSPVKAKPSKIATSTMSGMPSAAHGASETNVQPRANWHEWRGSVLAQIDQAIDQLEEQLTKTRAARAAVEAL